MEAVKGENKHSPGDHKTTEHRPPSIAYRRRDIHAGHADEMHDRNRKRNQRTDNRGAVASRNSYHERQPETNNGESGRQRCEGEVITDRNRTLVSKHGNKVRGPDTQAPGEGGYHLPIGLTASRTFLSAQEKVEKSKHAEQADYCRKQND